MTHLKLLMVTSDSKTWWTWCTRRRFSSEHLFELILSEVTDTEFLLPEIFALEEMKHAKSKDGKMLSKPFLDVCK
ncbi:hypothetical protein HanPSC8_Chr01g0027731 [Helianthus annuus]|nr:hypothetical protein HanPSC8_Chr01g0027731 [Helianthus annuus]